jgi:hypothetical protein
MHPLSVQIVTRDSRSQQEIRHQYLMETRFPRWELVKIFFHAFFSIRFS